MLERFPRQFGKYVLLKSLTRGGMGEIYLAASGQTGGLNKLCVIKKVITEKTDPAKVNRFLDEAKVVLRLSHANLVSTFDAGDVDGELFIAMELIEGKDLREIWNRCVRTRTRIPVDVALVVVREIARALGYVHTYGGLRLVHRDIAPPNILLSYFGEVKLTDFGLARSVLKQEHTAPGVVFGRASYLAPEQARGEVADSRTDVYSLGIVLWELLTGQPYLQLAGLDPVTSLSLVRNPKAQPPSVRAPWIAAELDAVALKALAADRAARFQSAEEMRRALADVMTRVTPRADPERVAEFLRGLYHDVLADEVSERERFLSTTLPMFRGERVSETLTPRTGVRLDAIPEPRPREASAGSSGNVSAQPGATNAGATQTIESPLDPDLQAAVEEDADPAVVPAIVRSSDSPVESLAASAQRARAGSQAQRRAEDASGPDAPTKVWRKGRGKRREDLSAQTFVGRVIDSRYRIQHRIGEGGMGTVYAAEHVEIGKLVAVKILHRLFSGEDDLVERFRREARAATRVGHPNIIDVSDFGTTEEGCAYFVMELLEGKDLADVLVQEGRLDLVRAVHIVRQICQALEAAHKAGIIHRDLKPENIFLITRSGQPDFVKVLDFGIASSISDESQPLTNPGMAMGTPEYMAPEQAQGRPSDPRTDVYAVGALLHEMVLGTAPFKASSQQAMFDLKKRPLESLRKRRGAIPAVLDTLILRALDFDPDRRPQTMAELEAALGRITWTGSYATLAARGLRPRSLSPPPAMATPAPRSGAVIAAVASDGGGGSRPNVGFDPHPERGGRTSVGLGPAPVAPASDDRALSTPPPTQTPLVELLASMTAMAAAAPPGAGDDELTPLPALAPEPPVAARPQADAEADDADDAAAIADSADSAAGFEPPIVQPASQQPSQPVFAGDGPASFVSDSAAAPPSAAFAAPSPDAEAWAPMGPSRRAPTHGGLIAAIGVLVVGGMGAAWMLMHRPPAGEANVGAAHAEGRAAVVTTDAAIVAEPLAKVAPSTAAAAAPPASDNGAATAKSRPEIVATPPIDRARSAMEANAPDDAIAVLRPFVLAGNSDGKPLLADALVASGWNEIKGLRWNAAARKAREALSLAAAGQPSHEAHALLGEALYSLHDFSGALSELTKAAAENPRDARIRRRLLRARKQLRRPTEDKHEDRPEASPAATSPTPSEPTSASAPAASAPAEPAPEEQQ